ncbi:MAG: energy transducer TonB [Bacteroidota bacterium]
MFIIFPLLIVAIILVVVVTKYLIDSSISKKKGNASLSGGVFLKKYDHANLNYYKRVFTNTGFVLSLGFILWAFEWKTYDEVAIMDLGNVDDDFEDIIEIPPTEQPPPPPPKIQIPEIIEVPDEEEIEEEIEVELDVEVTEETVVEEIVFEEAPEEEVVDEIFTIVEEGASFPGGVAAWGKYLQDELSYPRQAQRMGIEGRVFVQFVVEKDGSLTDVQVVKGIGAGCDEEALRVIKNGPKWKPGKQRGKAVRQKMIQNVRFKFSN